MSGYRALVRPRWSDMDVFGHINHARMVTLLEEARVPMLFTEARAAGLSDLVSGVVVVSLQVRYRAPVIADGRDIEVLISLRELKFSTFTLDYEVRVSGVDGPPAVTASTQLAPYDVAGARPRRLSDDERDFLARMTGYGEPT